MKGPILPVSAKAGSPQPSPVRTGRPGFLEPVCRAPVGTACPAGHSGWGFWAPQSLLSGEPTGCFLGAAESRPGTHPSPFWGWNF